MTELTVQPMVLKDLDLLIGAGTPDDFGAHVSTCKFTPSASTVQFVGGKSNAFTDVTTPTWVCELTYAQDWKSANSLSRYLYLHEGEHVPVIFKPVDGGPEFESVLIITPGAIGGDVNAVSTASVTLGLEGKPELVAA
jgi:hypothetical protein